MVTRRRDLASGRSDLRGVGALGLVRTRADADAPEGRRHALGRTDRRQHDRPCDCGAVENFILPLASALMPIPSLAWVPVFILWFGLGNTVAILIVFYAALFP